MSLKNLIMFSRKSFFAAVLFSALFAGGALAQDITPGSSVMEAKSKKPPVKTKPAPKNNSSANTKTAAKPNNSPRPKSNLPAAPKKAKSQPAENAKENSGQIDLEVVVAAQPVYPGAAKQAGAAGAVRVEVLVDDKGNVVSARAAEGHELLRAPAEKAALATKFMPRKVKGKAVQTRGFLVYCFGGNCD